MKNSCQVGDSASVYYTLLAAASVVNKGTREENTSGGQVNRSGSAGIPSLTDNSRGCRIGKFRLDLTVSLSICLAYVFYLILDVSLFKIGLVLNGYDCLSIAMEMCAMLTSKSH